jgi:hypothetical protein
MWNGIVRSPVAFVVLVAAASLGRAGEADLESRVEALEKRVEALEKALESRDDEIARLRDRLRDRVEKGERPPEDEADEGEPEPFEDALDEMLERLRRRGFDWEMPGRGGDPFSFPRSVPLPEWLRGRSGAFLGVELEDLAGGGVAIRAVVPETPAEQAGLSEGDVIAELDGGAVSSAAEVVRLVRSKEPGDEIEIAVLRDGKRVEMLVTLGERPQGGRRALPPGLPAPGGPQVTPPLGRGEATGGASTIEVEADVPGGTAKVSFSAPGLFMTDDLARELDLDDDAREEVEAALANARNDLAEAISELVGEGGGTVDAGVVAERRVEAERAAREALEGTLTAEQIETLERAQAESASRSQVSISIHSSFGRGPREEREERREPRRRRRRPPHAEDPADPGEGMDF